MTEKTQTKIETLLEMPDLLRGILEASPTALIVREGTKTIFQNEALAQLLGFASVTELKGDPTDHLTEASANTVRAQLVALYAGEVQQGEKIELRRKDGENIWVKITRKIISIDGRYFQVSYLQDVTDEERLRKDLESKSGLLDLMIQKLPDAVIASKDGKITIWNPEAERLFGYSAEEAIGMDVQDLYARQEHRNDVVGMLDAAGSVGSKIVWNSKKDGTEFPMILSTFRLPDGSHFGISKDVSELIAAIHKAERATALKDKFVTLVAHDLKSLLSGIIGGAAGLREILDNSNLSEADKAIMQQYIGIIERAAQQQSLTIDELLDIHKLQSGELQCQPELVSLPQLFCAELEMLELTAKEKGIKLSSDFAVGAETCQADPRLLTELVRNLLANAVKFCRVGDQISIRTEDKDNQIQIIIADTGPGMNKEQIAKLHSFRRNQSTVGSAGEEGTGLGLPFCFQIARLHGSNLYINSAPGQGTQFYLQLPKEL